MGKLRDALVGLSASIANSEKAVKQVDESLTKTATNVSHHFTQVMEGYQHTYMHINELLKKRGQKIEANLSKTLVELGDKDVVTFSNGINTALAAGVKQAKEWGALHKAHVEPAKKVCDEMEKSVEAIRAMLAKKKKKLLQSAKYKTKIAGYEAALQSLQPLTRNLKQAVHAITPPQSEAQFNKYTIKPSDKVSTIKERAGFLPADIEKLEKQGKDVATHARNARTFKLSGQLSAVQAMIVDADAMEKEAPE